jgi:hypothetical protein
VTVFVERGHFYKEMTVECGSTAYDGGINQCDDCEADDPMPAAREDESDAEYFERTER